MEEDHRWEYRAKRQEAKLKAKEEKLKEQEEEEEEQKADGEGKGENAEEPEATEPITGEGNVEASETEGEKVSSDNCQR